MIILQEHKEYFIIIDRDANWNEDCIFEGKEDVFDTFQTYADTDDYEDPTLKDWTFAECMDNWNMEIQKWTGQGFRELTLEELNYKI